MHPQVHTSAQETEHLHRHLFPRSLLACAFTAAGMVSYSTDMPYRRCTHPLELRSFGLHDPRTVPPIGYVRSGPGSPGLNLQALARPTTESAPRVATRKSALPHRAVVSWHAVSVASCCIGSLALFGHHDHVIPGVPGDCGMLRSAAAISPQYHGMVVAAAEGRNVAEPPHGRQESYSSSCSRPQEAAHGGACCLSHGGSLRTSSMVLWGHGS
jgi:diadenosine tetraphosphate (Ap4A) HIT family hydrolase